MPFEHLTHLISVHQLIHDGFFTIRFYGYIGFTGYLHDFLWNWCWNQGRWYLDTFETGPAFDSWQVSGSVSIAGIDFEGLFFLQGAGVDSATVKPYAFYYSGDVGTTQTPVYVADLADSPTKISSDYASLLGNPDLKDAVLYGFTGTPTTAGSGWRFKVAGTAGDISITSYTYFNLDEPMATAACGACGYSLAKKGSGFTIANPGCDATFTEEYLTIEGLSIGCATADIALDITCAGFNYVTFLLQDLDLGFCCSGITIDTKLTFTTSTKTFELTPCITMKDTCLTFEVGLDYSGNEIGGLNIYGVSFEQSWNGFTFTSKTALDTSNSCLFGKTGMKVKDARNQYLVMVPVTGLYFKVIEEDCPNTCEEAHIPSVVKVKDSATEYHYEGYFTPWCFDTEYYQVWESFGFKVEGDSCCGGSYTLTATTYFGDKYTLKGAAWHYVFDSADWYVDEGQSFKWLNPGETFTGLATADDAAKLLDLAAEQFADPTVTYVEGLSKKAYYRLEDSDTLFQWVKSSFDVSLGVGSAWTLDASAAISVYGWDNVTFGIGFEF